MDKLVAFFKNVWLKRGVALIPWGYTAMMVWVTWLNFAYFIEYENPTSLFVLYVFIHVVALGLMIYTRRQVFTIINCMVIPPIVFLLVIFAFGSWYVILPPVVLMVAMFFINTANETFKTVIGTLYLLMFVIGIAGFMAVNMLMGTLTFTGVDLTERDTSFEKLSPSEEYRIVRYINKPTADRQTAKYYIEFTGDDVEIPFGFCKKVLGCKHALTSQFKSKADDPVDWIITEMYGEETEMITVEGSLRENPYLKKPISETAEGDLISVPLDDETAESAQSTKETTAESTAETAAATAE